MNYRKPGAPLLRPASGKIAKPKHNNKIHLFGGISIEGLTPLVMFKSTMLSKDSKSDKINYVLIFFNKINRKQIIFNFEKNILELSIGGHQGRC